MWDLSTRLKPYHTYHINTNILILCCLCFLCSKFLSSRTSLNFCIYAWLKGCSLELTLNISNVKNRDIYLQKNIFMVIFSIFRNDWLCQHNPCIFRPKWLKTNTSELSWLSTVNFAHATLSSIAVGDNSKLTNSWCRSTVFTCQELHLSVACYVSKIPELSTLHMPKRFCLASPLFVIFAKCLHKKWQKCWIVQLVIKLNVQTY